MHGLYLRTVLLQSRMQADSVILPISNVAQTTQTLGSLSGRFLSLCKEPVEETQQPPYYRRPPGKMFRKNLKIDF